ncbi:MAG TPA: phosphoribosylanthranilate isomerase [Verrucomicrobiae bacterium]|nr:phosphoribosylanthranilate isomerase [Verrucomicrobiae bacterium]
MKIKICGITRLEDALAAVEAGADALGFMFYAASPRCITPAHATPIIRALPAFIAKVGVFVDASELDVRSVIEECGLDTLQFHGQETPEFCRRFRQKVIKAFCIRDRDSLQATAAYSSETWLLDSYVPGKPGGTGATFNWAFAAQAVQSGGRVILAGGLTPENVGAAVQQVHPYAVDVCSGVESGPGWKDAGKIKAFVQAARTAGARRI